VQRVHDGTEIYRADNQQIDVAAGCFRASRDGTKYERNVNSIRQGRKRLAITSAIPEVFRKIAASSVYIEEPRFAL
jgi:hypothetical protein